MPVGRFRDIWLNEDGTEIHLFTRNGGGNRVCWNDSATPGVLCECPGCIQTYLLPTHKNYLSDSDDDFDNTFAITIFSVPDECLGFTQELASGVPEPTLEEKTKKVTEQMQKMSEDELRVHPVAGTLINQLETALSNTVVILDSDAK